MAVRPTPYATPRRRQIERGAAGPLPAARTALSARREDAPAVTAVVLHFGGAAATSRCLARLAASDYPRLSVLVVDNSPADRLAAARLHGARGAARRRQRRLRRRQQSRPARAWRRAARATPCCSTTMRDIDPGDACPSPARAPRATRASRWSARGWRPRTRRARRQPRPRHLRPVPRRIRAATARARRARREWVSGCCAAGAAGGAADIGLLDEEFFLYGEDVDWCLRARRAGYRVVHEPHAVVHHADAASAATTTRRAYFLARNAILLARKHGSARPRSATLAACAALPLPRCCARLARRSRWRRRAWVARGVLDGSARTPAAAGGHWGCASPPGGA